MRNDPRKSFRIFSGFQKKIPGFSGFWDLNSGFSSFTSGNPGSCTIYNKKNKAYKLTEYYLGKKQSWKGKSGEIT